MLSYPRGEWRGGTLWGFLNRLVLGRRPGSTWKGVPRRAVWCPRAYGRPCRATGAALAAGAVARKAQINDRMLCLAEIVRPRLLQDGMFFVGMDIVGDKLMEINVFSPGGIDNASQLEGVNFAREVIHALEQKVDVLQR